MVSRDFIYCPNCGKENIPAIEGGTIKCLSGSWQCGYCDQLFTVHFTECLGCDVKECGERN